MTSLPLAALPARLLCATCVCAVGLASCSPEAEVAPIPVEEASEELGPDIDELRALGYAGYTEESVDPEAGAIVELDAARSWPGYSLFSNRMLGSAQILDRDGNVVHAWERPKHRHWSNCELLPGGDLVVLGSTWVDLEENEFARYMMRLDWSGETIWRRDVEAHHDVERTPDGRLATLTMESRRIPEVDPDVDVRDNGVAIFSADGELLDEWSLYDMLAADESVFRVQKVGALVLQGETVLDMLHANSVEFVRPNPFEDRHPLYRPGTLLVSFRHQDTIAAFDLERETVVWAWGRGIISGPHDATMLENGHVLLFDNGLDRGWSRVIEIEPVEGRVVWEYKAPNPTDFFTKSRGSSQRLPNGNTLIANSDSGEAFEVTPEGDVVWRFLNPNAGVDGLRATIVRMRRYAADEIEPLLE